MNINFAVFSFIIIICQSFAIRGADYSPQGPFSYAVEGKLVGEYYVYFGERTYNFLRDNQGNTILHEAAAHGHTEMVRALLNCDACNHLLMAVNNDGKRAVDICFNPKIKSCMNELVESLVFQKARKVHKLFPATNDECISNLLPLKDYIKCNQYSSSLLFFILNFDSAQGPGYEVGHTPIRRADFLIANYMRELGLRFEKVISDSCPDPQKRFEVLTNSSSGRDFYGEEKLICMKLQLHGIDFSIWNNGIFCCAKKSDARGFEPSSNRPFIAALCVLRSGLYGKTIIFITDNAENMSQSLEDAKMLGLEESKIKRFLLP